MKRILPFISALILMIPVTVLAAEGIDLEKLKKTCEKSGISGGLIVHLDCGDGERTPSLRFGDSFIVHGLDSDMDNIRKARADIRNKGLYGPVSIGHYDGLRLPYSDNLVNLVVSGGECCISRDEIERVLVPGGVAIVRGQPDFVKPVPKEMDEWTHYLHGPDNNAVSQDELVAPMKHLRWDGGPKWSRSHEADMSMTAMASAGGRLFYFIDEGPIGIHETPVVNKKVLPDKASLVARDAYNGIILWKRPMEKWGALAFMQDRISQWKERDRVFSTPPVTPRRLVVVGDRIYVTLGFRAPVSELDAVTGKTLRTFEKTGDTEEILYQDGFLYLHVRDAKDKRSVMAFDVKDAKVLWEFSADKISNVTLAAGKENVFYFNGTGVVAIDKGTGKESWRSSAPAAPAKAKGKAKGRGKPRGGGGNDASLVLYEDYVILCTSGQGRVFSAKDGKKLWEKNGRFATFRGKPDVFVAGGLLWMGSNTPIGLDVKTGKVARQLQTAGLLTPGHHTRCYRARGTENFLIWSKRGVEFMDIEDKQHSKNDWVRGTCRYGVMPANGMLYTSPTPCFCYPGVKKNGFNAFSAKDGAVTENRMKDPAVVRGPAFDNGEKGVAVLSEDWPAYRCDNARSGFIRTKVPVKISEAWSTQLKANLTPPVVRAGKLYVSEKDTHTVHSLDAGTGKPIWHFVAGGTVDSPPTIYENRVLFGCTDGKVYCLNAADGKVRWIFTAAPCEKTIVSYGKLQSAWPVHGSVIVENGIVYCAAGISTYFDRGIYMYGLNIKTGEIVHKQHLDLTNLTLKNARTRAHDMDGARNDILVSTNGKIYLTLNVFDMSLKQLETKRIGRYGAIETDLHLVASGGFLDDTGFDRIFWMYARRWPGLYVADRASKAGQILVFDDKRTYGLHKFNKKFSRSPYFAPGTGGCELFADDNDNEPVLDKQQEGRERGSMSRKKDPVWSVQVPVDSRAMVLATDTLFFAGTPDVIPSDDPYAAMEGRAGGKLWAVSAADGKKLAEYTLESPPVLDGLIAANGKLYIVTRDGKVHCWK